MPSRPAATNPGGQRLQRDLCFTSRSRHQATIACQWRTYRCAEYEQAINDSEGAYERPADAFLSGSMSDCAEKGFVRNATHPEASAAFANGRVLISGNVDDRHRNVCCFEPVSQLDARNIAQVDVEGRKPPGRSHSDLQMLPPWERAMRLSRGAATAGLRALTLSRRHRRQNSISVWQVRFFQNSCNERY
jgi:hypothetical protein